MAGVVTTSKFLSKIARDQSKLRSVIGEEYIWNKNESECEQHTSPATRYIQSANIPGFYGHVEHDGDNHRWVGGEIVQAMAYDNPIPGFHTFHTHHLRPWRALWSSVRCSPTGRLSASRRLHPSSRR